MKDRLAKLSDVLPMSDIIPIPIPVYSIPVSTLNSVGFW